MDDRTRLTYLTRHYYELQGIRTLPLWIYFVAIQPGDNPVHLKGPAQAVFPFIAVGLAGLFAWLGGQYFRRRFGWLDSTWIFPKSRIYWGLYLGSFIWAMYCIFFSHFHGFFPYAFTIVWISPLFDKENPVLRHAYFALAGLAVFSSAMFLQITHSDGRIIIVIQCVVLLALCIADHLLLMSLCTPPGDGADA
jgi:hypothetical protein